VGGVDSTICSNVMRTVDGCVKESLRLERFERVDRVSQLALEEAKKGECSACAARPVKDAGQSL